MAPALGRKRRAQPEGDESPGSSPEPAPQRRRTPGPGDDDDAYASDTNPADPALSTHEPVKRVVRLALACEYQRRPIRRADISEKALGSQHSRHFKRVFEDAQTRLRSVFGMEMVELPAREKVTVREKRARQGAGAKPAASWALRSTLPSAYHDPEILPPPAAPTAGDEATYTSVYTLLISVIGLSGGALPAAKLERHLRRLGMEDHTPVPGYGKTEALLKRMEREGYLLKVKEPVGAGEEDVSWHVGPRGKVEVGKDGVRGLADAVYGDLNEGEEADLQRRLGRSLAGMDAEERRATEKAGGEKGAPGGKNRGRRRKDAEEEEDEDDDEDD